MAKHVQDHEDRDSKRARTGSDSKEEPYEYLHGFGAEHTTEAIPNALPKLLNTPQRVPYDLYTEQVSGTSFTTPRACNQRTWVYRKLPSARHPPFEASKKAWHVVAAFEQLHVDPNRIKWRPFPIPEQPLDFVSGLKTLGGSGSAHSKTGYALHIYTCNESMTDAALINSDGDFLIVPQEGALDIRTELGCLFVPPGEIVVVPRGLSFSVGVGGPSRGYIAEVFQEHFRLPELGPIGANGLANPRDFQVPVASFVNTKQTKPFVVYQKFLGKLFQYEKESSIFDVVAWQGNYYPFKYNLAKYCVVNSVSFDHLDPSIFTVLTAPSATPGVAVLDFVIFPPRWCVQNDTFRPPYYHRNTMTEFMGNIKGVYEAKPDGFPPGAATLHSCMVAHGPAAELYEKAIRAELVPQYLFKDSLAFMFESTYALTLTDWAREGQDKEYYRVWEDLKPNFEKHFPPE